MPPRVSFSRPDAMLRLYLPDATPDDREWPGIQRRELDAAVVRQQGGIPQLRGDAHYILPLPAGAAGAGYARVRDIRTGDVTDYDIVEVDANPVDWTLEVVLMLRAVPIGAG